MKIGYKEQMPGGINDMCAPSPCPCLCSCLCPCLDSYHVPCPNREGEVKPLCYSSLHVAHVGRTKGLYTTVK